MIFKKTYNIEVEIDLNKCHNDAEWGIENWEMDNLESFVWQVHNDLQDYIDFINKNNLKEAVKNG